jgi:DNA-binding NarL/FixJ family response regulator
MTINIVVIEDHPIVREGIVNYLNACDDMQVIDQADTVDAMLTCITDLTLKEIRIDIVLLDLQLAQENSLQHINDITALGCKVLILSSAHRYETLIQAVSAGAFSFISKSVLPGELALIIADSHRGKRYFSPEIKPKNDIRLALTELTDKELTVLKMLASGLSNSDIAHTLSVNIKTIRFHTSNILSKLDISDRTQAAVLAWRQGLVR